MAHFFKKIKCKVSMLKLCPLIGCLDIRHQTPSTGLVVWGGDS